ncbi:MAG TPA: YidB family protein, partial [Patescibacteria group bacterium]|nr:YidB family protein [Patescibacteria group bacterium]
MATNDPMGGLGDLLGGKADGSGVLPPGLGDALGGLLGGGAGGTAGLDGLVKGLKDAGLGDQVASWIGTGQNQPVSPEQIGQALGPDKLEQLSSSTGLDVGQLLPM